MAGRDDFLAIPHPRLGTTVNLNPITRLPDVPEVDVPFMEAFTSGLILANPISGAIDRGEIAMPGFKEDPGYNITKDPALEGMDLRPFVGSTSAEESQWRLKEVERNAIHQRLASYRGGGWGMFTGVLGDPVIMGPALGTAKSAWKVAMTADIAAEVVNESILHSQQPLRTKLETATNIATVGLVDAALWRLSKSAEKRAKLRVMREAAVDYVNSRELPVKFDLEARAEELVDEKMIKFHLPPKGTKGYADLDIIDWGSPQELDIGLALAKRLDMDAEFELPIGALRIKGTDEEIMRFMDYFEDILYYGEAEDVVEEIAKRDKYVKALGFRYWEDPELGDEGAVWFGRIMGDDTGIGSRFGHMDDVPDGSGGLPKLDNPTKGVGIEDHPGAVSGFGESAVDTAVPGMGFSPGGRIMKSASDIAKRTLQLLVDVPYRFAKTEAGMEAVPASVEAKIKKAFGDFASMTEVWEEQWKAYRKAGGSFNEDEFMLQVHRQMETGVRGADPHINRVTDYFKKFDDAYFTAEQAAGVAGRRRRGGHVMRIYNDSKIRANRTGLRQTIAVHLRALAKDAASPHRLIRHSDGSMQVVHSRYVAEVIDADPQAGLVRISDLEDYELESLAEEMVGSLQTRALVDDVEPDLMVIDPASIKSRMLDFVPTRELEPWLETNALSIMGIRSRQHYRAQAMREAFPEDPTMQNTLQQVADEYQALREAATDPKEIKRLVTEERETLQTLKALRDSVHGLYGVPDNPYSALVRTGRMLRLGALTGYGANIASTSLTDFLTPALRNGLAPFREGLRVLFKGAAKKEYLSQIRKMGVAIEHVTNNKAAMLINMSHVTKGEQQFLKYYGKITRLDWVTDTSQGLNAMSHLQLWKKWADNWGNVSEAKRKRLLDVGIDESMLARIKQQWDTHGEITEGIRMPSTHKWEDTIAAEALENAVRKETFMTTIVPGKGDIPLWMQTETGKFAGMFMSFVSGAHQRLLIAGFQRSDAAFYSGILVSAAAGMLVQAGKDLARGKDMSQRDPIEYAVDSIDKTGLFGWWSVPIQPASSLAAGRPFEFTWRNLSDQVFSPPPIEWLGDVTVPLGNIATGHGEMEDLMDLLRVTPMVNALHVVDLAERLMEYKDE